MYPTTFTILPLYVLIPIKVPLGNCDKFSRSVISIYCFFLRSIQTQSSRLKKVKVNIYFTANNDDNNNINNNGNDNSNNVYETITTTTNLLMYNFEIASV